MISKQFDRVVMDTHVYSWAHICEDTPMERVDRNVNIMINCTRRCNPFNDMLYYISVIIQGRLFFGYKENMKHRTNVRLTLAKYLQRWANINLTSCLLRFSTYIT